ncbi:hypothetical protein CKO15_00275 [Halorhodospira abdelmalekii]|uniref:phasin family protein n=1 Tax=Halorhodospira abdelmalekii TaxID=421629 RepID=UPI0019069335|nr:phasin family protein [Halorhodospira abdelmalekii]MBK1733742.1 hypothetical protein [Halorhodospira abdelmalekii]
MMNEEMLKQMTNQWGNYLEPARQLNGKALEHWEKMAEYQIDMARRYADVAVGQLREAATLQTPEQVQSYMRNSSELLRETSDRLVKDARTLTEMGQAMNEEMQKAVRDQLGNFVPFRAPNQNAA